MRCVETVDELKKNMSVLDCYLEKEDGDEHDFAINLIKKGTCFIAVKVERGYKFYPSRFIGYANNTMKKHKSNTEKDGKETNPAISFILNQKVQHDSELEKAYRNYCSYLGFTAREKGSFGVERKYWKF